MPVPFAAVIPATSGIQNLYRVEGVATLRLGIPVCAGMTIVGETMVGEAK